MEATLVSIEPEALALVLGGAATPQNLGRCGPGDSVGALGNLFTPECKAHDQAVRGGMAGGQSQLWSQIKALPLLPAAVGSWFREKLKK